MRIKVFFIAGIICMAAVAGVIQSLSTPRTRDSAKGEDQKGKEKGA